MLNALNPIPLRFIHEVEGINTKDNEDLVRSILSTRFDEPVRIGLYGTDDKLHYYRLIIPGSLNTHFSDPDGRYYDSVYFGPLTTNRFMRLSLSEAAYRAFHHWGELLGLIMKVPLQIFPIDQKLYADRVLFTGADYFWENHNIGLFCESGAVPSIRWRLSGLLYNGRYYTSSSEPKIACIRHYDGLIFNLLCIFIC